MITYAYSRTEQHRGDSLRENCVYFTELFADLESYQTHLTEAEAEPVVELFKSVSASVVGYVNSPLWHDGIKAQELQRDFAGLAIREVEEGSIYHSNEKSIIGIRPR